MKGQLHEFLHLSGFEKVLAIVCIAISLHVTVKAIEFASRKIFQSKRSDRTKTVSNLLASGFIFFLYVIAVGAILVELGVSLGTYVASASIIGIAVGFGTQNVVQDAINGLTIITTNLFSVGDMVEISGQVGIVKAVNIRFVVLQNPFGAEVYIPARTVANVINYPRGYLRCLVDVNTHNLECLKLFKTEQLDDDVANFVGQFPGIMRAPPEVETIHSQGSKSHYLRIKFRIWPGRGAPIENLFKQTLTESFAEVSRTIDNAGVGAIVSVNYEVSE